MQSALGSSGVAEATAPKSSSAQDLQHIQAKVRAVWVRSATSPAGLLSFGRAAAAAAAATRPVRAR